ncbi:molecular chaperone TorD family protein [Adlercreutzia sp. R21]|uniref:TorD/DmsD family molecular chaperone n=1 Tax=Adlercreutzia wanghongyangiae TaxID=3111451 RepID=UPI002DB98672|nr:molecular chaperone TorD family protein [Adlercreutzia sp. R21]MEC4184684.1 molecular chaperone TorD family protein [Adlercreutzia sp. R21]
MFDQEYEMREAARTYLYLLFQRLFRREPDQGLIAVLCGPVTEDSLALCLGGDSEALRDFQPVLESLRARMESEPDEVVDALRDEYTRLLLGPHALPAPPWESVYVMKDRTLFQACTLEVRKVYASYGLLSSGHPHVADDHLALELDFMHMLCERMTEAGQKGNREGFAAYCDEQRRFLDGHLLRWTDSFARDIGKVGGALLYPQAAQVLGAFLQSDRALLDDESFAAEQVSA